MQWAPPGGAPAEPEGTPDAGPVPGWQQGLAAMEANLDWKTPPCPSPSAGSRRSAGARAGGTARPRGAGETYVACGYPTSCGLAPGAARETAGRPELIAPHRHPVLVGVVGRGGPTASPETTGP